jgi:hypothetical protein
VTPTLAGRWQTRALLLGTVGVAVSIAFGRWSGDVRTPLVLLAYVFVLGLGWDVLYQRLQARRWDRDWPPAFQLAGGVAEAALLWWLLNDVLLWWLLDRAWPPGISRRITAEAFALHYSAVWLAMFVAVQGPIRVLLPRWRFRGGAWL